MKKLFLLFVGFIPFALFAQQPVTIYFPENVSELSAEQKDSLDRFFTSFENDTLYLKITASADSRGSEKDNQRLVATRLNNIESLIALYPNLVIEFTENLGESKPVKLNGKEQFELSRYAKIEVIKRQAYVTNDRVIAPKSVTSDYFFRVSKPRTQRIPIDTRRKQKVEGIDGTFVTVYPGALQTKNGEVYYGRAIVSLREYYRYDEMLADSLHTMAGDQQLETGGMIYLNIETETGEQLEVRKDRAVHIGMPTDTVKEDMLVFRTKEISKRRMTWYEQNQNAKAKLSYIKIKDGVKLKVVDSPGDVTRSMGIETFDGYNMKSVPVYGLDVTGFGLINCDRFLKVADKHDVNIAFSAEDSLNPDAVFILFREYKSIMTYTYSEKPNELIFAGVPRNTSAFIFAFREKNGEIQTATMPLLKEQSNYELVFSPTALNLKESLSAMESTLP